MTALPTRQTESTQIAEQQLTPPRRYAVLLLNDDYTPMDFVVDVLTEIFHLPHTRAMAVMLLVHQTGKGLCGIYQKDIADTKCQQVLRSAQEAGYPLMCVVELA
ncbi:ATP-dependent Clp protease adapter ClpS [Snodgrassella sp. CFCC 13594]|uniref:ATP-dependent Clp protease adapter ClpS n=1 Tax=Snodgrassella sp. CFCC 13594 TaxID=1775559 RepID=UPI0008317155|nr:ATP-dependent Clp protease adapter ClpS [Snodgrassella sp. CFCC 13594]